MDAGLPLTRLPPAAERQLLPAAAFLWLERAWMRHLKWVAVAWAVWLALSLTGLAAGLPGELRVSLLYALGLGTAAALFMSFRDVALPTRQEVLRRIERASGVRRGALALLDGNAVDLGDPVSARLWARARTEAAPKRLRIGWPRLALDDAERYGLLPLLAIGLFLGALLAKGDWHERIAEGFSPYATSLADVRLTVTIEPPAYAGEPARTTTFQPGEHQLAALKGSRMTLRIEGPAGEWRLLDPADAAHGLADGQTAIRLVREGRYDVRFGRRQVARLDVRFASDAVPTIRFDGDPTTTATGALRIAYRITEDHGAVTVMAELRSGSVARRIMLEDAARSGAGAAFADLTADPLAGEMVNLRLLARDGAGQTGHSETLRLRLPERSFRHPVARELIAVRKALIRNPASREDTGRRLTEIASRPDRFGGDLAVFAGLRSSALRLAYDMEDRGASSVIRLLWDIAVDLEDGGASRAMDDMRRTMDDLARRMDSASDEEMAAMLDRLAAGMGDYLRRQLEAMLQQGQAPSPEAAGQMPAVDLSFLDAMMQDLRDRLAAGDTAGAQAALDNLRRLMENMQFGGPGDPAMAKRAQAAAQAAQDARDLEARERDLQAETIAESIRRAVSGEQGAMRQQAERQGEIERAAQALAQQAGEAGMKASGLGEAQTAMREAREALAQGRTGDALRAQERAASALAQAAEAMEGQAQAMAQAAGGAMAMQPGQAGSGIDPLGRPGRGFGQGIVELPDEQRMRRVQAIRKLLEERASDPRRSDEERAYYLRLLKRF